MARLLGVRRQSLCEWCRRREESGTREQAMNRLVVEVKAFHQASDGTYGARRIHGKLRGAGWVASRKTVAKAIRIAAVAGISARTFDPPTTIRCPNLNPAPDLVQRCFDQGIKDAVWFSGITYLTTEQGLLPVRGPR